MSSGRMDPSSKLRGIEHRMDAMAKLAVDHDAHDNRRFEEVSRRIESIGKEVREDIVRLGASLTETITGDAKTEGMRERMRSLLAAAAVQDERIKQLSTGVEARFTKMEDARQWLTRMLWGTIAGLVASVIAALLIWLITVKHG